LSTKNSDTKIHSFIKLFVKSKNGQLVEQTDGVFKVKYPNQTSAIEYTYEPTVAREKKAILVTPGSPTFQQILDECVDDGVLCQITVNLKEEFETLIKNRFKDSPFVCENCTKVTVGEEVFSICEKPQRCYHQINNGKIVSIKAIKKEPVRYFQFYFSATFRNKLRPRNEELIMLMLDEERNIVSAEDFSEKIILDNESLLIQDFKASLKPTVFDELKAVADKKLEAIVKVKLALFDLPLSKEKAARLRSFDKRLRREHLEQAINNKYDADPQKRQATYEVPLKREEESLTTNIAVKFINLLVINTAKINFEVNLDNNATIRSAIILGINHAPEVTCPICRNVFSEGYATQDSLYVCRNCIRQSIDTAKIYSKKMSLKLDETLNDYFEQDEGFVCSVCGKKHSRLLEFKCNHDNSSVCIFHYDYCDLCGRIFSKLNLMATHEFKRKLCPKHTAKCENCQAVIGVDEIKVCKTTGERICNSCMGKSKER
jgi:hypothetical protein